MTNEKLIAQITAEVLRQLRVAGVDVSVVGNGTPEECQPSVASILPDLTAPKNKEAITLSHVINRDMMVQMKQKTPARIGIGSAGARLKTTTYLTLRADHACARDAVFRDVKDDVLERAGLFTVQTLCTSRTEHLTRPDLGRQLSERTKEELRSRCRLRPQVQVYISDGLSSGAVDANLADLLPTLMEGLEEEGIAAGTPFFLRFGRVPAMDVISQTLEAEVTCVLLGERPGLGTAESMSAYMAYRAQVGMPEARRTVVSNIHRGGIPSVEAGAYLVQLLKTILERRQSGVDLKL